MNFSFGKSPFELVGPIVPNSELFFTLNNTLSVVPVVGLISLLRFHGSSRSLGKRLSPQKFQGYRLLRAERDGNRNRIWHKGSPTYGYWNIPQ